VNFFAFFLLPTPHTQSIISGEKTKGIIMVQQARLGRYYRTTTRPSSSKTSLIVLRCLQASPLLSLVIYIAYYYGIIVSVPPPPPTKITTDPAALGIIVGGAPASPASPAVPSSSQVVSTAIMTDDDDDDAQSYQLANSQSYGYFDDVPVSSWKLLRDIYMTLDNHRVPDRPLLMSDYDPPYPDNPDQTISQCARLVG
jgi:hypothetical protein